MRCSPVEVDALHHDADRRRVVAESLRQLLQRAVHIQRRVVQPDAGPERRVPGESVPPARHACAATHVLTGEVTQDANHDVISEEVKVRQFVLLFGLLDKSFSLLKTVTFVRVRRVAIIIVPCFCSGTVPVKFLGRVPLVWGQLGFVAVPVQLHVHVAVPRLFAPGLLPAQNGLHDSFVCAVVLSVEGLRRLILVVQVSLSFQVEMELSLGTSGGCRAQVTSPVPVHCARVLGGYFGGKRHPASWLVVVVVVVVGSVVTMVPPRPVPVSLDSSSVRLVLGEALGVRGESVAASLLRRQRRRTGAMMVHLVPTTTTTRGQECTTGSVTGSQSG